MRKKDKRITRISNDGFIEIEPATQPDHGSSFSVV